MADWPSSQRNIAIYIMELKLEATLCEATVIG
jgi:hypothetical protein